MFIFIHFLAADFTICFIGILQLLLSCSERINHTNLYLFILRQGYLFLFPRYLRWLVLHLADLLFPPSRFSFPFIPSRHERLMRGPSKMVLSD